VTTTNLGSNPRLLKELDLAYTIGHECDVIEFSLGNWSDEITDSLKLSFRNTNFIELNATRNPFLPWLFSSIIEKVLNFIYFGFFSLRLTAYSLNKRSILLNLNLNKNKKQYDWIIAHNPGAFFPAFTFSKRIGCKLGLDIEDYHPGETNDFKKSQRILKMMQNILPKANYCSFASLQIKNEVEQQLAGNTRNWLTIINGFPREEFISPIEDNSEKLKLIWFSQNIAENRGLEYFINATNKLYNEIELHLIGNLTKENSEKLLSNLNGIYIHEPLSQRELHVFISRFDIGLAIEPGKDFNNSIALSNKLLAYVQAGLYVIATPTFGQLGFLNNSNLNYSIVNLEEAEIFNCLKKLLQTKHLNRLNKQEQFKNAQKYAWEEINMPLIEAWNS
jgi:hypothetical protein